MSKVIFHLEFKVVHLMDPHHLKTRRSSITLRVWTSQSTVISASLNAYKKLSSIRYNLHWATLKTQKLKVKLKSVSTKKSLIKCHFSKT